MRRTRGRIIDVDSLHDFDQRVAFGAEDLAGWRICGLDLSDRTETLDRLSPGGATFFGCTFDQDEAARLESRGALVVGTHHDSPVDPARTALYTPGELYGASTYAASLDARAYAWLGESAAGSTDAEPSRIQALHDHAIDEALRTWIEDRHLVGVMGGHALRRGEDAYGAGARLGHRLGSRLTVTTGGGPGAMEAANLGAALAEHSPADLEDALTSLSRAPGFRPSIDDWAGAAFAVIDEHGGTTDLNPSLGIPTWHYGHEPPNAFATTIAKYFRNATREAILLQICDAGIVFLPGAGGTVQEVFQDGCENYYADPSSVSPMVLVGVHYWTETLPVWPLLQALARDRPMEKHIHLVDDVDQAADLVLAQPA